ncbi:MAG: hypothetical protein HOC91_10795 [Nitrospinaceae bacterium]|nr:hypothetical protein [Nitrospinaceae bacterium]MBT3432901.1 hypothetical protein [Nitrospinaceae bacterium]MBT3823149.1 hypothetical protein [Nitrospinaceae bacterium]MBT4095312.1 hypothetical protein [Nitrospinaceae bacterium]MBT4430993.1 hypothetical protein [Nitrospinaceae bacterium]
MTTATEDYFPRLGEFPHSALFEGVGNVWDAIGALEGYVRGALDSLDVAEADPAALEGLRVDEGMISSQGLFVAPRAMMVARAGVFIEKGVRIEPGVVVKGPTILCADAELRHGAYLRGSCLIGPRAIVGHATEVKNSAFLEHAEAGHFAYVGDSLLGADSNLGAGTKLANLQFRTEAEKREKNVRHIEIRIDGERVDTGLRKFGAIVGEHTEIGCNVVTSPGTLLGPGCWIVPNTTVPKGLYPKNHIIRAGGGKPLVVPRKQ